MKIYIICKDKSVIYDNNINLNVYDHIETDYEKAKNFLKKHEDDLYKYIIIEEEIMV